MILKKRAVNLTDYILEFINISASELQTVRLPARSRLIAIK
jgi:hypothetical protein